MKDATLAVRVAYDKLLNRLIYTRDGVDTFVPVYNEEVNDTHCPYTRENPPSYYIILSNQTEVQTDINKCGFNSVQSIQVDCCAVYPAYNGAYNEAEEISSIVREIIMQSVQSQIEIEDFKCYKTELALSRQLAEKTKALNIYRKITTFNHSLKEL